MRIKTHKLIFEFFTDEVTERLTVNIKNAKAPSSRGDRRSNIVFPVYLKEGYTLRDFCCAALEELRGRDLREYMPAFFDNLEKLMKDMTGKELDSPVGDYFYGLKEYGL